MTLRILAIITLAAALSACDSHEDKPAKPKTPTAEQRADNPLLKMQDDTVNKVKNSINQATEKQQQALDKLDKQ